jgi:hypothetical protein
MLWRRKAAIIARKKKGNTELFPLPEGKSETFNYRGELRRWNTATGKYDLKA